MSKLSVIDTAMLTRECLTSALTRVRPHDTVSSFADLAAYVEADERATVIVAHLKRILTIDDFETFRRLRTDGSRILVLGQINSGVHHAVRDAIDSGATGVGAFENFTISMLSAVIDFVREGGTYIDPKLLDRPSQPAVTQRHKTGDGGLTPRQMEVLQKLSEGKPNKIIAYELGMSDSTVKVHVSKILSGLGAQNRTQAMLKVRENKYGFHQSRVA